MEIKAKLMRRERALGEMKPSLEKTDQRYWIRVSLQFSRVKPADILCSPLQSPLIFGKTKTKKRVETFPVSSCKHGLMETGIKRWLVNISQWNPSSERFEFLLSVLPSHERSQIIRFAKLEDKKRALVSRLLQFTLVHQVLNISFDKINIPRTLEGKPYLKFQGDALFPNLNFSISHHGDYVGLASELLCLVGLDIVSLSKPEHETSIQFVQNFSPYFTSFEWNNIIHAGSSDETLNTFFRYWGLKEAYVKAIGVGLSFGLHRLELHHMNWIDICVYVDGEISMDWRFCIFELENNHLACIAKGHPKEAGETCKKILKESYSEEKEYQHAIELPEQGFVLCTLDQLVVPLRRHGI
ncbi:hypothetical protein LUZ60_015525 [Juncus effusus]|nr:hypothetical protein LUZ60_015525 [Juncus effusus]